MLGEASESMATPGGKRPIAPGVPVPIGTSARGGKETMAETRCPKCEGPATAARESYQVGWFGSRAIMKQRTVYRTTAADPARVQAMEELLREMRVWGVVGDDRHDDWQSRIAALLEGGTDGADDCR